jgi:hypothetical protein
VFSHNNSVVKQIEQSIFNVFSMTQECLGLVPTLWLQPRTFYWLLALEFTFQVCKGWCLQISQMFPSLVKLH